MEGHELNVIRGLRTSIACLSFEVNLSEFWVEDKQCVDFLMHMAEYGTFNYVVDCQRGLELEEFLPGKEFQSVLDECKDKSIEVFWETTISVTPIGEMIRICD